MKSGMTKFLSFGLKRGFWISLGLGAWIAAAQIPWEPLASAEDAVTDLDAPAASDKVPSGTTIDPGLAGTPGAEDPSISELEASLNGGGDSAPAEKKDSEESEPKAKPPEPEVPAARSGDQASSPSGKWQGRAKVDLSDPPAAETFASDEIAAPSDGSPNQITNLEFKIQGASARIVVTSKRRLQFTETASPKSKQVVFVFENTSVPEKLQRAYDTTEFASSVGLFTLLQLPKSSPPSSKLIVQLREAQKATPQISDRNLIIEFPNGTPATRSLASESDDILNNDNIYGQNQNYRGQTIHRLEIKNSDVQDVLRLIARSSGYSIVVGDDVTGKIGTLSLENIPWDQAFTLVLQSKKLGYVRDGNVLRVGSLSSLKLEKDEALAIENAKSKIEPLKTLLIPISYAKADEISSKAKSFLSDRGTVDTDVRTNTVIIKDIEKAAARIQKLIAAIDIQPPRVSISAKIVEINSSFSRDMGFSNLSGNSPVGGNNISQALNMTVGGKSITNFSAPAFANLAATLELAELENKGKTLANPSVSVIANQKGTVSQSLSFFVPQNTIVAGAVQPGLRQITATLSLEVTPIVAGDGAIFMKVAINNDIPTINGANSTINQRHIDTQVLLENGDTAVIGGIFSNTVSSAKEGIPFLMQIPILGFLVSRTSVSDTRNEIFIFLSAKVTNADESLKRTI